MKGMKRQQNRKEMNSQGPVDDWTTLDVGQWLVSLDLSEYRENFVAHDIRGRELIELGRTDLKDLGINKVGHLKRIQQAIKDLL